jgi:replicative DNA helicase
MTNPANPAMAEAPDPVTIDEEAEQAVISLAFRDVDNYSELVQAGLAFEWFYPQRPGRWFWRAIDELYTPPATEIVVDDLMDRLRREIDSDRQPLYKDYFAAASDTYRSAGHIEEYRSRLINAYQRRVGRLELKRGYEMFSDKETTPETTTAYLERKISELKLARTPMEIRTGEQIADDRWQEYLSALEGKNESPRMEFELDELNYVTNGGVKRKNLTVVTAMPNVGKSAFLGREFIWASLKGEVCVWVSLEMDEESFFDRAVTQQTGIPTHYLEQGRFQPFAIEVKTFLDRLAGAPLLFVENPQATTETVKRAIEHTIRKYGHVEKVFVDYAQRLEDMAGGSVHDRAQFIANTLAAIPKIYDCHLFAISRIKGDGEAYGGLQLLYNADAYIELKNELATTKDKEAGKNKSGPATAFFRKQRGAVSALVANLYWNSSYIRFTDSIKTLPPRELRYGR